MLLAAVVTDDNNGVLISGTAVLTVGTEDKLTIEDMGLLLTMDDVISFARSVLVSGAHVLTMSVGCTCACMHALSGRGGLVPIARVCNRVL